MRALTLLAAVLLCAEAAAQSCPPRAVWPTGQWTRRTEEVAQARAAEIAALEQFAFTLQGADGERIGTRTDAVLIVQGGEIVYEKYARGWSADKRHLTWSVSKSFTNAMTAIAVREGALSVEDSICEHLGGSPSDEVCEIKVRHLLEFGSGLDWHEVYEGQSNQASSVLAMLYGVGRQHMAQFVWAHPFRNPPGTTWMYSSGDTTLLMHVVGNALRGAGQPERFPWTLLFEPIGITPAWERDAAETYVGSSYVYATPQDMARFGYLYLNDGCWNGTRILPEGWVATSTTPSQTFLTERIAWEPGDVQGWQFWLNAPVPALGFPTPWPSVPEDAYAARGHWGQSITIIPSLDLIVVRVADDRDGTFDFNAFLERAIAVGQP